MFHGNVKAQFPNANIPAAWACYTDFDQEQFRELMKVDDWNEVVIIAKGLHIQHYLNGHLILDFTDHPDRGLTEGILALQLHGGKPMWAEFKDIRIRSIE